ncbi:MAG: hypothetical protein HOG49_18335 [Candidatus Scalindua sp.]|mgnify:CR=1|jgi:hypothetical protein|nr:hypothetical protein [Candidatus Scalindua sp.]
MTVYERNYNVGKQHHDNGWQCTPPMTLPDPHAFRGYMDGYGGNEFREPVKAGLIIDELHKKGMVTIKGE